jgi:chemotaxis protein CheZ
VPDIHAAKQFFENKIGDANDARLALFDELIVFMDAVAARDYARAENSLNSVISLSQGDLYKEVGKVTRKLHDTVKSFNEAIEPRMRMIATQDMPNAADKLNYVIGKTEEAANLTMGIVDKYLNGMGRLNGAIRSLEGQEDALSYLQRFSRELEEDMTTVLTTQSFQDLTGQTIKKVIRLVGEIERELVSLIATFGVKMDESKAPEKAAEAERVSQSDVDDLLKEFGF